LGEALARTSYSLRARSSVSSCSRVSARVRRSRGFPCAKRWPEPPDRSPAASGRCCPGIGDADEPHSGDGLLLDAEPPTGNVKALPDAADLLPAC
jgi:hypothetical protein